MRRVHAATTEASQLLKFDAICFALIFCLFFVLIFRNFSLYHCRMVTERLSVLMVPHTIAEGAEQRQWIFWDSMFLLTQGLLHPFWSQKSCLSGFHWMLWSQKLSPFCWLHVSEIIVAFILNYSYEITYGGWFFLDPFGHSDEVPWLGYPAD